MKSKEKRAVLDLIQERELLTQRKKISDIYTEHLLDCVADRVIDPLLLNMISGYETAFFYEALTACGNDICEIVTIYDTLHNLTERDELELIYVLIKAKYIKTEIHFPRFFSTLRENEDLFRDFMYELLADLEEIITEEI